MDGGGAGGGEGQRGGREGQAQEADDVDGIPVVQSKQFGMPWRISRCRELHIHLRPRRLMYFTKCSNASDLQYSLH